MELGSFEVLGVLELGGGGVHSYEKALIGWFFNWSTRLWSRRVFQSRPGRDVSGREASQQLPPRRTEETGSQ
ncbi:hypothetical protein Taro_053351 [Colocasia esculenta]|uniref:Uncharacterized protein n=1 Tax=Colocasia esculenta TaxID=4460 RepID=A0A843XMC3_COLES|nr:hypothetical protein [Colocasia esculenta]